MFLLGAITFNRHQRGGKTALSKRKPKNKAYCIKLLVSKQTIKKKNS